MLNKYIVAIPSYKRPLILKKKTLKLLIEHKIDPKKIIIFVSDKEQKKIYEGEIEKKIYNKIVVGEPGIKNIRNFMANYFKEKQRIFYMDDDISHIFEIYNNKEGKIIDKIDENYDKKNNRLHNMKDLHKFIESAFDIAKQKKCDNWGVYPVENPYFMKPTTKNIDDYTTTKLVYIIGFMTGVINNKKAELRTIDDKEDYERSIKYYLKDGGVLRFTNVTCRTRCYKEPGGMQINRTKNRIHDSAVYLTHKYPLLCTLNTKKKSGYTEIRLRDRRFSKGGKLDCKSLLKSKNNNKKTKKLVEIKIEDMNIPKCKKNLTKSIITK